MMTAEHCRNSSTKKSFSHYLSLCDENTRKDNRKIRKENHRFELFGPFNIYRSLLFEFTVLKC